MYYRGPFVPKMQKYEVCRHDVTGGKQHGEGKIQVTVSLAHWYYSSREERASL